MAAETRLDPADLVNAAIDALIRERCELPSLSTLLRLAGNAHRRINSSQWQQVHERLTAMDVQRLDELLTPSAVASGGILSHFSRLEPNSAPRSASRMASMAMTSGILRPFGPPRVASR